MEITVEPISLTVSLTALILLLVGTMWAGVKYLTKKNVDQLFNKNLEDHKNELSKILEFNKFDLQRKMHDFSLYNTKKHEIYPKLFELFLMAEGRVGSLTGFKSVPDFKRMNAEQLMFTLKEYYEIPDITVQEYSEWDTQKEYLFDDLNSYLRRLELNQANSAITEARNMFLISRLYLSEEVTEKLEELSKNMRLYVVNVEYVNIESGAERIAMRKQMEHQVEKTTALIAETKKNDAE